MPKSITPSAREREVYRYYQPLEPSTPSATCPTSRIDAPRSSSDPVLTAFAQLGAHRLRTRRGMIILSTRDTEYIVAEAGVGLGLQQDDDVNDPLWHGAVALVKQNSGVGMDLCRLFSADENASHFVFNDLKEHDAFKDRIFVAGPPHARFLACVPLRSARLHDIVIGTYIVVDDKPRDGLSMDEVVFLEDMGVTVMDHLEAQRNNQKQHRSERMVKAIGLFIEGKSTLREWWLQGGHKTQNSRALKRGRNVKVSLDGLADVEFGVQDPVEDLSSRSILEALADNEGRSIMSRSHSSSTLSVVDHAGDGRPNIPNRDSAFSYSDATNPSAVFSRPSIGRGTSVTTTDSLDDSSKGEHARHTSAAFDMLPETSTSDVSKDLQEALLTKDTKSVFSRASNLIREAGGVNGSIFYDASVGSFGGASESDIMGQRAPGNFHEGAMTASDDDVGRRSSDTDTPVRHTNFSELSENCCSILGFSTRNRSSLKGHSPLPEHQNFPEKILRTLLKRYPHGKVFNFEEDGSFSASETDNVCSRELDGADVPQRLPTSNTKSKRNRISREAEAQALSKALPGARSVFWFPLWDANRERWYAGSLVWSTTPTRMLCPIEDLTYLAAFGNSVMAEVARLSALVLTQMKTDFISSISHELRSPLHGVLASVEFLQETTMSEVQADMVANISASGRVLLDTINHVLDFSKVNKKLKAKGRNSKKRKAGKKGRHPIQEHEILDNTVDDSADICVLSEEVVESIWAGRHLTRLTYNTPLGVQNEKPQSLNDLDATVTVIMDVQWRPNWTFEVDAGAWRRILLNLFGNSMKYTKSGFIKVSLAIEEDQILKGKQARSVLVLKVKDSGKGISKEFLKNHLYKPFTQEDSLAVGAGLGLSIVRHICQDLGGDITFASEQGVGTEATVKLPMIAAIPTEGSIQHLADEVKSLTTGKSFILNGFDRYPDISETPTGILSSDFEGAMLLKSSVHVMLSEWFMMEPASPSNSRKISSDVVIIMESGVGSLVGKLQSYAAELSPMIVIVLCSAYPQGSAPTTYGSLHVFYVPQPFGPHKIAKTLHHAFSNPAASLPTPISEPPKSNGFPFNTIPYSSTPDTPITFETTHELATPTSSLPTPLSPTSHDFIDRRMSIDTSVIQPGGMRVLLVEDNEINLKLLVAYMRKLKINHATAINGLEALNAYKEANGEFDVIFMDISMPIMSGIESTRHIRRFERENSLQPVALIALTGAANPSTRQEAFSSGVDLFLTKPVPMKSLKVMLDDLKANGKQGLTIG